jgi:hypothetical protein
MLAVVEVERPRLLAPVMVEEVLVLLVQQQQQPELQT